jgi:hypothetical protein
VVAALARFDALSIMPNVSPRLRVLEALSSAGITASQNLSFSIRKLFRF